MCGDGHSTGRGGAASTRTIQIGCITMTEEQARRAGCLPEQRRARLARAAALLKARGLGDTQEARVFGWAAEHGHFNGEGRP